MDEMEIKHQIDYDRRSGKIYGFTNMAWGALTHRQWIVKLTVFNKNLIIINNIIIK